jgi:hypothetical protein
MSNVPSNLAADDALAQRSQQAHINFVSPSVVVMEKDNAGVSKSARQRSRRAQRVAHSEVGESARASASW